MLIQLLCKQSLLPILLPGLSNLDNLSKILKNTALLSILHCTFQCQRKTKPVSYTHLDVYKRQTRGGDQMELSFLYSLQALHNPALDKVMIFFTNLGEYGAVWILTAILLLCFQKYRRYGALMLVSLLVTFLIGEIGLKNLIMRERPLVADPTVQQLIPLPSGSSFPSGHTASSFTAAWILWKADRKFGAAGLAMAVCCLLYTSRCV